MDNYGYHVGTRPGLGNAASFQSSGMPWITSSFLGINNYWVKVPFPKVTKSFTVINKLPAWLNPSGTIGGAGAPIVVFFGPEPSSSAGIPEAMVTNHFVTLQSVDDSFTFDVKCKECFVGVYSLGVTASFQMVAELTNIGTEEMFPLSGSGYNLY